MADRLNDIYSENSPLASSFFPRPRVDRIFDRAARGKLVYVIAGAGYGKTQAVYHYLKRQEDAVVRWLQLTESDNVGARYWESLTHGVAYDNPDLAAKLREFGFPETPARFRQFSDILKKTEHRSHKTFLVLDDFHLIHSKQALTFAERCAHLQVQGACVIIISRSEPQINAVSLFSRGRASIVNEDDLRFTENEIIDFFTYKGIPPAPENIQGYIEATEGWALAIKLLSIVLARSPGSAGHAVNTMKQNIFRLFETEAFNNFPDEVKKSLVRLSLVSDLPLTPLSELSGKNALIKEIPQLESFMWYDSYIGDYRVHPLYIEFLKGMRHILSDREVLATYRWAAQWGFDNNFFMDAVGYFAKSYQYERILEIMLSYPFKLPYDACGFLYDTIENIDMGRLDKDNYSVSLLKSFFVPLFLMGMGRYDEAKGRALAAIREWGGYDTPFTNNILSGIYGNLAYMGLYSCTATHIYDIAGSMKKSVAYHKLSAIPPVNISGAFGVADVRSFACLVGEGAQKKDFGLFLEDAEEAAGYIAETAHNMYYGYADLAACELAYFRGQMDTASRHAHSSVLKAREKKQYSIEAMAEQYILRMAVHDGDYALVKSILTKLGAHLENPAFWNRQLFFDLFTGLFYIQIGMPTMAPAWLAADDKGVKSEVHIPIRELIVGAKYCIATKKYSRALTMIYNSYPRDPRERFVFGELTLSLLSALALLKNGDIDGSMRDMKKAYNLSYDGEFEMPFIELGANFRPLAAEAQKHADCAIPEGWLKSIELKAAVYVKKSAVVRNAIKNEQKIIDTVQLSERETGVLNDLYHGLSREEIAVNQFLSINTVKKILQSIFIKLDAGNSVDAIRIALEMKLIG